MVGNHSFRKDFSYLKATEMMDCISSVPEIPEGTPKVRWGKSRGTQNSEITYKITLNGSIT